MSIRRRAVLALAGLGLAAAACTPSAGAQTPRLSAASAPATSGCTVLGGKADRRCTPGATNPQVTQADLATTICRRGWTATVRPPASYTTALKDQQKPGYGEADVPDAQLEEDHLVPLELGGAPRDEANLWPEPRQGAHPAAEKDAEENALNRAVCNSRMTLTEAQAKILADWTH